MKTILIRIAQAFLAVLALLLTLGVSCITSGNVLATVYLDDVTGQTNNHFEAVEVDLQTDATWNEHKDDLNSIDDIGFACKIKNNADSVATGQVYISAKPYSTPDSVVDFTTKILDGISVPPHSTREIEWAESYDYITNFDVARKIVYGEHFYVYFLIKETYLNIDVTNIVLFLSLNGKA